MLYFFVVFYVTIYKGTEIKDFILYNGDCLPLQTYKFEVALICLINSFYIYFIFVRFSRYLARKK